MKQRRRAEIHYEWQVLVSLVVISLLFSSLATSLAGTLPFPDFSPEATRVGTLALSGFMLLLVIVSLFLNRVRITRAAVFTFTAIVTIYLLLGVTQLVASLPHLQGAALGLSLLRDAASVWVINIILFAVWCWLIDGSGPAKRRMSSKRKGFLFPQEALKIIGWEDWKPSFYSYLFMSFQFSTTFGPTDIYVLSRRAKFIVFVEVTISLVTITMFIARAFSLIG